MVFFWIGHRLRSVPPASCRRQARDDTVSLAFPASLAYNLAMPQATDGASVGEALEGFLGEQRSPSFWPPQDFDYLSRDLLPLRIGWDFKTQTAKLHVEPLKGNRDYALRLVHLIRDGFFELG